MQVKVSEGSAYERTLEVTLEQAKVEGAYQRAFGKAVKRLALPGFRRGKVPAPLAKKYITDDGLGSDVVEELIPEAYRKALEEQNLQPISEPKWELVQRSRDKELIFKVSFEVKPILEIADYKGIKLKNERHEVTDEMVQGGIDEMRASQARLVPVEDRPLKEGDVALVDYSSTLDGINVEGGSATNYLMEINKEHFIPGFVDNLVGLEPGAEKQFELTFPSEYPNTELAGQAVVFKFKVHEIKEKQLPEVDDELAKAVSPFQTIAELREDVQARLEANNERRLREQVAIKCIDKLIAQVSNEAVPRSLHSWRTNVEVRRRLQEFNRMGVTMERYLADRQIDQQAWLRELSVMGMLESRVELLLEAIANKEDISISPDEMEQLFQAEANNRKISVNELHRVVEQDQSMPLIRYALLRAKVMDFLFENADVTYVAPGEPTEDEAPALAAEATPTEDETPALAAEANPTEETKPKARKKKEAAPTVEVPASDAPVAEDGGSGEAAAEPKPKAKRASTKKKTEEA